MDQRSHSFGRRPQAGPLVALRAHRVHEFIGSTHRLFPSPSSVERATCCHSARNSCSDSSGAV